MSIATNLFLHSFKFQRCLIRVCSACFMDDHIENAHSSGQRNLSTLLGCAGWSAISLDTRKKEHFLKLILRFDWNCNSSCKTSSKGIIPMQYYICVSTHFLLINSGMFLIHYVNKYAQCTLLGKYSSFRGILNFISNYNSHVLYTSGLNPSPLRF